MATITTSTQAAAFGYPSQSMMDRSPYTGNLVTLVRKSDGSMGLFYSTNNGASWTDLNCNFTRTGLQEWSSLFIDTDGFVHLGYRVHESSTDKICYRRASDDGSGNLVWESEILIASASAATAGLVYQGVDIVATKIGETYYVHFAVGTTSGANIGVTLFSMTIKIEYQWFVYPYWAFTVSNSLIQGTRSWSAAGSGRVTPSIDLKHNGDGHTASTPDLWVSWGRATVYMTKLPYASGKWTGSATPVNLATPSAAMDAVPGRFDGNRFLVPVPVNTTVSVYERNVANTATTVRTTPAHPTGNIRYLAIDYEASTGNIRVFAIGTSSALLYYIDYTRATNLWSGAWTSTALTIVGQIWQFGTRRSAYGNARYDLYTETGASPFTLSNTAYTIPFPPNTPVITSPTTGSTRDVAATLAITWTYSDPDPSDPQSGYVLRRQKGAGAAEYWRASDSTWQATEQINSTASTTVTLPTAWGLDADATHTYSVKVLDSSSVQSAYSASVAVIPSAKNNPTITAPTASQVLTNNRVTATWTVASQSAYRVKLLEAGVQVFDSGWLMSTALSYVVLYTLKDNTAYTLQLTTRNAEGLESTTASVAFTVNFVEPRDATIGLAVRSDLGLIRLNIANHPSEGLQSPVISNEVWRRIAGTSGEGTRIASVDPSPNMNLLNADQAGSEVAVAYTASTNTTVARTTTANQYLDGVAGLAATATASTAEMYFYQTLLVPVIAGETYTITGWSKAATTGRNWRPFFLWYDAASVGAGSVTATPTLLTSTAFWQPIIATATVPTGVAYMRVAFYTSDTVVAGEVHYFDRFSLKKTNNEAVVPGPNMLTAAQADLETSGGWTTNQSSISTISLTTEDALDGIYSLKSVSVNGTTGGGAITLPAYTIPCKPNTTYTGSVWYKAKTTPRAYYMQVYMRNNAGGSLTSYVSPSIVDSPDEWKELKFNFTTPATAAILLPGVLMSNAIHAVGEAHYADRISLREAAVSVTPTVKDDFTAVSGVDYEYRVNSISANGTSTWSEWTG